MTIKSFIILSLLFGTLVCHAQTNALQQQIDQLIATKKATVGVSVYHIETGQTINVNSEKRLPMQSVFKFHIALTVLHQVDNGKLSMNQKIRIQKSDLQPKTWSPLRDEFPEGEVDIPLSEILTYTIVQSDNNGCDILLKLIGGTKVVNDYIHSIGVKDVAIEANEKEMHKTWDVQYRNWTTPQAATLLLKKFFNKEILSGESYNFLWDAMTKASTGANRIRRGLPQGTDVADKTGSSNTSPQGITAATNDIGIVTLPNGGHYIISVFVSDSKENNETNEQIIAEISKLAWDYFTDSK